MAAGADDGADDPTWRVFRAEYPLSESGSTDDSGMAAIHEYESWPLLPPARDVLVDMEEMMSNAAERAKTQVSLKPTRIHRFPHDLRGISGPDGRYVVPSMVALGPVHHGRPHLREMEEVKRAAAFQFCRDSGRSVREVYERVLSVAGEARSCFDAGGASLVLLARMSDAELAAMMLVDGCFVLKFMVNDEPPVLGRSLASWPTIVKDVLLLENQVPFVVLDALTEFISIDDILNRWIDIVIKVYFLDRKEDKTPSWIRSTWLPRSLQAFLTRRRRRRVPEGKADRAGDGSSDDVSNGGFKPPHLLGLLWLRMTLGMPPGRRKGEKAPNSLLRLSSNAVHLAQIGIKLTASTAGWFADVEVRRKPLVAELSLSPLFLNDVVACILVNLAALEVAKVGDASSSECDGFVVSSYLSVLGMLMDREEDVQQFRGRGVLCSHLSNAQALAFFKGIVQHLRLGFNYFAVVQVIDEYMRRRPVRIAVHRFLYSNFKLIAAILSIASVLVGIFKALYSLR